MATDSQFIATGPAGAGFQTTGSTLDTGVNVAGNSVGGAFFASATAQGQTIAAVKGSSAYGSGFVGGDANDDPTLPDRPRGVYGESLGPAGFGVEGIGGGGGVAGQLVNTGAQGVLGFRDPIFGELAGVYGESDKQGVTGVTVKDAPLATGVFGFSKSGNGIGVRGETVTGVGIQGRAFGSGLAGLFDGNVRVEGTIERVTGDLHVDGDVLLTNRDVAERFEATGEYAPGTVMVMGDRSALQPCTSAYDKRAIGVVSGAGPLRPAITLGVTDAGRPTVPVAMVGTAFCLVEAESASIEVGDLLATSDTYGHAMKAQDPSRCLGAAIGKALAPLKSGRGLIPIVVALQ